MLGKDKKYIQNVPKKDNTQKVFSKGQNTQKGGNVGKNKHTIKETLKKERTQKEWKTPQKGLGKGSGKDKKLGGI